MFLELTDIRVFIRVFISFAVENANLYNVLV